MSNKDLMTDATKWIGNLERHTLDVSVAFFKEYKKLNASQTCGVSSVNIDVLIRETSFLRHFFFRYIFFGGNLVLIKYNEEIVD